MTKSCIENVKVLDCTIRDGGLLNNFYFKDDLIKNVYNACVDGGVDYMELGYKASKKIFSINDFGKWKFCNEDDVRKVIGDNNSNLKISIMADVGRTDYKEDILPKNQSIADMIRVASYIEQIPEAIEMINYISDKGYETTLNLMAVSKINSDDLERALEKLTLSDVNVIYLVDSFGSLYTEDIKVLTEKYISYAKDVGKQVGIHAHNNRQMAYANTIQSLNNGASFIDVTMAGMGRGAGNCPIELMLGYINNSKYNLRPIISCIQDSIIPLRKELNWGFDISYALTGQLNIHPRQAISFVSGVNYKQKYVEFFDSVYRGA
jgi:4-hydroxy 2-oxovalerate aldolase